MVGLESELGEGLLVLQLGQGLSYGVRVQTRTHGIAWSRFRTGSGSELGIWLALVFELGLALHRIMSPFRVLELSLGLFRVRVRVMPVVGV